MTRAPSWSPLIVKEFRALLPIWIAGVAALAVAVAWRHRAYSDIALIGYVAGIVALGAHTIGHEYGHRTVAMLLAQPVSRRRLFATKLAIAAAMMATLAIGGALVFLADRFRADVDARLIAMPIIAGLCLAPFFTIVCRNTLAGGVLSVSGPMMVWVIALVAGWWVVGAGINAITARLLDAWVWVAAIVGPTFAALGWRAFSRMEAVEGMPLALTLPRWLSPGSRTRRPAPWRALVSKEIHLQQMTIAITLFYAVIWLAGMTLRWALPASVMLPMEAVLLVYCMGLTIVIGALASAEERQLGTLELQLLQPVSALRQWAVKCAVNLTLAVLLGVVLPAVLIAGFSGSTPLRLSVDVALIVVALTASSLYLSSLSTSGVRAMAWSLPAGLAAAIFMQNATMTIAQASEQLGLPLPVNQTEAIIVEARVVTVLIAPALLWFGYVNHTSADHPLRRTLLQIGALAALTTAGIIAGGMVI